MSGLETIHTVVFAETENGGNPCPVTFGAEKLTDEELLAMAKEFDMECLFIVPSGVPGCAARFRYFTPGKELASCGHATIAGVSVLLKEGKLAGDSARIETASGPMEVSWEEKNGEMYVTIDQFLPEYGPVLYRSEDRREAAEALGLTEEDLADFLPVQNVSTSRPKLIVPVKSRALLDGCRPDFPALWAFCDKVGASGFYPFAIEGEEIFARQFPNNTGYPEDPATGVAASALGCYLASEDEVDADNRVMTYFIRQGQAMGRPSVIGTRVTRKDGQIVRVSILGSARILKEAPKGFN